MIYVAVACIAYIGGVLATDDDPEPARGLASIAFLILILVSGVAIGRHFL